MKRRNIIRFLFAAVAVAANPGGPRVEVGDGLGETALPGDFRFFKVEVVLP